MSEEFVNKYEIRVIGLQRSGNHAIINWIIGHFDKKQNSCFINFVEPNTNPFSTPPFKDGIQLYGINLENEKTGYLKRKEFLIYSYEDEKLKKCFTNNFEKNHDKWVGKSLNRYDILILRDPYNLTASRLKREYSIENKLRLRKKSHVKKFSKLWIEYAKEFIGETNFLKNKICINYNQWFLSKKYRKSISKKLRLNFNDKNFNKVTHVGGGSSFDGIKYNRKNNKMNVLDRWEKAIKHNLFKELLKDKKISYYSKKIFGNIINKKRIKNLSKKNKSVLVTLADRSYIDQVKQLFSSAHNNGGWKGDYLLLSYNIPSEDKKWFKERGIKTMNCKPLLNIKVSKHPLIVSSKLYVFKEYFKRWDNVLFLDADIIVKSSLEKLSNVKGLFVVNAYETKTLEKQFYNPELKVGEPNYNKIKLLYEELKQKYDLKQPTFNSGVMAFSTDIINPSTFKDMIKIMNYYKSIITNNDESVLSLYFYKNYKELYRVFNVHMLAVKNRYLISSNKVQGIILHFVGNEKTGKGIKAWDRENYFYNQWIENLRKAEHTDFNIPEEPKDKWSLGKIIYMEKYLEYRKIIAVYFNLKIIVKNTFLFVDRQIGIAGIKIKKFSPELYQTLKGLFSDEI